MIGNYFLICIFIKSYIGLPEFIENINVIFIFGICFLGAYNLWRKSKAGTLTEYEKRGWFLMCIFFIIIHLSCISSSFNYYIYGVYLWDIYLELGLLPLIAFGQTIIYSKRLTFIPLYCYNTVYNICDEAE